MKRIAHSPKREGFHRANALFARPGMKGGSAISEAPRAPRGLPSNARGSRGGDASTGNRAAGIGETTRRRIQSGITGSDQQQVDGTRKQQTAWTDFEKTPLDVSINYDGPYDGLPDAVEQRKLRFPPTYRLPLNNEKTGILFRTKVNKSRVEFTRIYDQRGKPLTALDWIQAARKGDLLSFVYRLNGKNYAASFDFGAKGSRSRGFPGEEMFQIQYYTATDYSLDPIYSHDPPSWFFNALAPIEPHHWKSIERALPNP